MIRRSRCRRGELAAHRASTEHEAHVARSVSVDDKEPLDGDGESRLLARLARGSRLRGLPAFHPAAGKHPARAEIRRPDDEDAALGIDCQHVGTFDAPIAPAEQPGKLDDGPDE